MSDPFLAHIISQTRSNIDLLIAQNLLSHPDGTEILAKLPSVEGSSIGTLVRQTQHLALQRPDPSTPSTKPVIPARRAVPPPKQTVQVRALWNWNDDEQVQQAGENTLYCAVLISG
jgi:hypothetical protein